MASIVQLPTKGLKGLSKKKLVKYLLELDLCKNMRIALVLYIYHEGSRKKSSFFSGPFTKTLPPPSSLMATFFGGGGDVLGFF